MKAKPAPPSAELNQLIALFNARRYSEVEDKARTLIQRNPDSGLLWKMLGVALQMQGKEALSAIQKTAELMPNDAEAHFNLGVALKNFGRLDDAVASYRRTLALKPDSAETHYNLGATLNRLGLFDSALASYRQALVLRPGLPVVHLGLGKVLTNLGQLDDAMASFHRALEINPDNAEVHFNLGVVLKKLGQPDNAAASYRHALKLSPDYAEAHSNLGNVLRDLGQIQSAMACFHRAVELKPLLAEAHYNLGNALLELGNAVSAETSFRRAIEINPDWAEAHASLGTALKDLDHFDDALAMYQRALEIKPDYSEALNNIGTVLQDLGRQNDALESYRRALKIKPDNVEAYSNLLFCLNHSGDVDAHTLFAEHRRFAEHFEAPLQANWPQHGNSRDPERCLQVGFVSGDLRKHAVAQFFELVLKHLNKYPGLSLHAYYNHVIEDNVTQRLRGYMNHWHSIAGMSDIALAQKIREDGIDILYDLSGHTGRHRLLVFARKPAPLQVSWIGYPATTGLNAMDYYQSDRFLFPGARFEDQFTEKIMRLPASSAFLPSKEAPPVNDLPALGNGYMTFGSFNRLTKITRSVVALWAQLLRALPDSRMLLGAMPEEGKYQMLIEWFAQEGITRDRLSFHARGNMERYQALHHQVDVCLDTFPYNGGTTTFHALWMGVPTLTLGGQTMVGWVGASILGHVELTEEFAAHDAADFVQKGITWNNNLAALADIRFGLRTRFAKSARGQPAVVAASMERALRIIWQRWCAGLPAESFEVPWKDIDTTMHEASN